MVSHLSEYEGKKIVSVARGDLDLGELENEQEKEQHEKAENEFESVLKQVKEVLGDKIKEVRLTYRLTTSPACIVADENDMNANMQRIMESLGQAVPAASPIFELNPEHAIVTRLKQEPDDERFAEWTNILSDQAVLAEGGKLKNPSCPSFYQRKGRAMKLTKSFKNLCSRFSPLLKERQRGFFK